MWQWRRQLVEDESGKSKEQEALELTPKKDVQRMCREAYSPCSSPGWWLRFRLVPKPCGFLLCSLDVVSECFPRPYLPPSPPPPVLHLEQRGVMSSSQSVVVSRTCGCVSRTESITRLM